MNGKPLYLTKNLRTKPWSQDQLGDLEMSADGMLTNKGLEKLIRHFTRFRVYPQIHTSWFYGTIPKDVEVSIHDSMMFLLMPLDWAPCSPLMDSKYVYNVPRSQAHMFVDGSILNHHTAARISRSFIDPSCIFDLMEKDIVPWLGEDFIAIRSTKSRLIFSKETFDVTPMPAVSLEQRVNLNSMANQVKIKYR